MFDKIKKWFGTADEATDGQSAAKTGPLDGLWAKMNDGKYGEVITAVQPYLNAADKAVAYDAKKLLGLAYFQSKEFGKSQVLFEELCMVHGSVDDFFNLCTAATMNGEFEKGKLAISEAIALQSKLNENMTISIPNMRFYYLHALRDIQQWERAFEELQWLGELYKHLVIRGTTFLYMRGVPFFEYTMKASKPVLEHIGVDEAKDFIVALEAKVDEERKEYLREFEQTLEFSA